jgi:D-glycero-D-manno-heptose 1,7-bisphosphate phosphatase
MIAGDFMGSGVKRKAAVFLDRDGTLIEDVGFLKDPGKIDLFPDTIESLKRLLQHDYLLFVITNQSGVADGFLTHFEVDEVNSALARMLAKEQIIIAAWHVCPHNKFDDCECRKPGTAFLEKAAVDYDIDLSRSFVVGDHPHDAVTGEKLGVTGVYLLTGHGEKHRDELPDGKHVFKSLSAAADWICNL